MRQQRENKMAKKSVARKGPTGENVGTLKSPARAETSAAVMSPREAEFYRRQAERLRVLADQCDDPDIRDQIAKMAKEWAGALAARQA
jgi:hypothetical protein